MAHKQLGENLISSLPSRRAGLHVGAVGRDPVQDGRAVSLQPGEHLGLLPAVVAPGHVQGLEAGEGGGVLPVGVQKVPAGLHGGVGLDAAPVQEGEEDPGEGEEGRLEQAVAPLLAAAG